jgi:hypothetical protein
LAAIGMAFYWYLVFAPKMPFPQIIRLALFTVIGVNIFLSSSFYPNVLKYQLGNDAAAYINKNHLDKNDIAIYGLHEGRALHFYAQHIFPEKRSAQDFQSTGMVITSRDSLAVFRNLFPNLSVLHEGGHFGVTALSLPFLNPATRNNEVPKYVLLDLDGKQ